MASGSLVDCYNSRTSFDKINPLIRSAYNTATDYEEYKQKLLTKVEFDTRNGNQSFLDSIEEVRREQRARLDQTEHNYYNQLNAVSFDIPHFVKDDEQYQQSRVTNIISKPPIPVVSRRSPSPLLISNERIEQHIYHQPISNDVVRESYDDTNYFQHQATPLDTVNTTNIENQIERMWDELELENYMEKRNTCHSKTHWKNRRPPSAPTMKSWAGRITKPEPFCLTNATKMGKVHRKNCTHEAEVAKAQKEAEEELMLSRSFKANPVPAHVRMPLYEQLRDEQRLRREQVHCMTKEYLKSISKPFGFESREKAKRIVRRHSYSDMLSARREPIFKAKPLPDFYYRTTKDIEQMKENSLYRTIKKEMRARELLRQSNLPPNMKGRVEKMKQLDRSMSANDLARIGMEECTFKPKTNGYYMPNYDKLHSKFMRQTEQLKQTREPTKCKPFLLHTSLIPSRKEQVLDDIRHEQEMRHLQTFQIKGKQLPTKSTSGMNLSSNLQQPEAIPIKTTEAQRLREKIGKRKRREAEVRNKFEEKFQRSRSAKEKRLKERIYERAKLQDKSAIYKAERDENFRRIKESMYQTEDDYARQLDDINNRVERRPLLLENDQRDKTLRSLEKEIRHAMSVAKITEKDLMRQKFNPPDVRVSTTRTIRNDY